MPFSKLLGTVVTERVFDMIMLLLLTLVVVVSQFKQVGIFLDNNEEIKQKLYTMFHSPWTYVVLGVLSVGWQVSSGLYGKVLSSPGYIIFYRE